MKHHKGQYTVQSLATLAIVFVVGAIAITMGALVTADVQEQACDQDDGTWGSYNDSSSTFPVTETYTGCCSSVNASVSTECLTWASTSAVNVTEKGLDGLGTFGDWLPTIAIVLMAAIVIGILLYAFKFSGKT